MDARLRRRIEQSGYGRPGFAANYDRHRPAPPAALPELLLPTAGRERLHLVVDLGSGTGLSTRLWAGHADDVVGVEPNDAMREWAEHATREANVRYVGASSYATGLDDASADIVTASQSLHWMDPAQVFPELGRILRTGGVFCAYQYVAVQTPLWRPEAEWENVLNRKRKLRAERGIAQPVWEVSRERLEESGIFRFVRELALHSVESGDGERLVGLALSEGSMTTLLEAGVGDDEVGLDRLRAAAAELRDAAPWWIAYRVWIGLK